MNTMKEKYMGESPLTGRPNSQLGFVIKDGAVSTQKIADKAVTLEKIADEASDYLVGQAVQESKAVIDEQTQCIKKNIKELWEGLDNLDKKTTKRENELQNQINGMQQSGIATSSEFGDNPYISVSQKTLTDAFTKIWSKLEDITGEALQGIYMVVTPEFFVSETGADVHISATTVETNGKFEHIAFYLNGELLEETDDVEIMELDAHIDETTIVKCVAKIMGIEYTVQKAITHYNSFWLGASTAYTNIMDEAHLIPIENGMRGAYDVNVAEGDYIFVIVGDTLKDGFIRADLNGFEIPFEESETIVDGVKYRVFTSENEYQAGTYNIDING